jgi:glycerol uptake facilitator-like aquaporin
VFYIFWVELLCTTLFVSLILSVKFHDAAKDGALAVAITLFGMIHLSGPISGGCLNPAVGLVQSLLQRPLVDSTLPHDEAGNLIKSSNISMKSMWIYVVATTLGGVFAGLFQLGNGIAQLKAKEAQPNKAYSTF